MTTNIATRTYVPPRDTKSAPVVSLRALRQVAGLTLEQLAGRIQEHVPELTVSRGTLSAIESGSRGVSGLMLQALELAYGLESGSLITDYHPRRSSVRSGGAQKRPPLSRSSSSPKGVRA